MSNLSTLPFDIPEKPISCFSLRLGVNCNYSHPANLSYRLGNHEKIGNFNLVNVMDQKGDFAYPLSVDGHIFKTDFIKKCLHKIGRFSNPNVLESKLQNLMGEINPNMVFLGESVIVGVPVNLVNDTHKNRQGIMFSFSENDLNIRYNNGETVDMTMMNFNNIKMAIYHKLGVEEIKLVDLFLHNNENSELTVFDVGCNRGLFSDIFSNLENITIHCFEPIESLYNDLEKKYNGNKNIILNKMCLSDSVGTSDFYRLLSLETDGCSSLIERPVFKDRGWLYNKDTVKITTIDDYCKKNNIRHIDFIKIDVEGAEFLVFNGMLNMLKTKNVGMIQFEYGNTFKDGNYTLDMVYNLLKKYGYNLYILNDNNFNVIDPNNIESIKDIDNINLIAKYD
jgi:FkbM family methyltransferase